MTISEIQNQRAANVEPYAERISPKRGVPPFRKAEYALYGKNSDGTKDYLITIKAKNGTRALEAAETRLKGK
jgi:hypothetical protein